MEAVSALVLTIVIEAPIACIFLREWNKGSILAVVALNLLTHPLAWLAVANGSSWWLTELAVMAVECFVLVLFFPSRKLSAFVAGVMMNLASASLGILWL